MLKQIFEKIYTDNKWGSAESRSGPGSNLSNTREISVELPIIIKKYGITSMLDAACGDFNWMKYIQLGIPYYGCDIVERIIKENKEKFIRFSNIDTPRTFLVADITKDDLPRTDLILCRDILYHLSFDNITKVLKNFIRHEPKYVMITSMGLQSKDKNRFENSDIANGTYRCLNLQEDPLYIPEPIYKFKDGKRNEIMGLYTIEDIAKCKLL